MSAPRAAAQILRVRCHSTIRSARYYAGGEGAARLPYHCAKTEKARSSLWVRDGHHDIRFSRSWCDRAILIDAEVEVPQPAADLVRGATAAEDRPSEIILEDIARPVSRKHPAREDMPAV